MRTQKFETVVWKEGKYYVAQCLNVDISSFGRNKKEALKNLEEALGLYFDTPKKIAKVFSVSVWNHLNKRYEQLDKIKH